ncbi:transglutaminase-like domain-containing protein [Marihabitans asiaticum]|uniref:Transglutaminase superfamily protein n=1 Tax=Marihabitans asiaticum TaxID=415218 RepID=A0A560WG84_9MICO|nr:transglutaminase-like domain-containing protein [Marihabitans asiaticum]TWD16550.1 transglutaminase superfamily protein [Marihabitans asiaticum]
MSSPIPTVREQWIPQERAGARDRAARFAGRYALDRDGLVDLAMSAVVTAIALVGLRTGFIGWQWVLAAAGGAVLGLLVTHVVVSHRWPAVVTVAGLVLVYLLLGGPLAVRQDLIGGVIPSGQTFADLIGAAVSGWKRWLTMMPPVDARGPLVALPLIVGLVASAVLYSVARTTRRPWILSAVVLAVIAASIVLGTLAPAGTLVQGALLVLVLLTWLVLRDRRTRTPLQNGAGHRARLVTALALATVAALAATLLGPLLPGRDGAQARTVARSQLEPPFDIAQYPSPLSGYRQYTEPNLADLYDRPLLEVEGLSAGQTLRIATLDRYDGSAWGAGNRAEEGSGDPGAAFQQVGTRIAAEGPGEEREVTVTVPDGGFSDVWLPTAGTLRGVEFAGPRARELSEQMWLNVDTETALVPAGLQPGDRYTMTALVDPAPPTELPEGVPVESGSLVEGYDASYLDGKVDLWSGDAAGGWPQLRQIAGYMSREGAYTDGGTENSYEKVYLGGHSTGRLARFVGSSQLAGNDEQFAATLALAANRLGMPARVVMGAVVPEGGVVKGQHVHAWVEVETPDGWVAMMPETFVPDRNKKPKQQQIQTEEERVGAQVPPPAGVNPPSVLQGPEQAQNDTDLRKKKTRNPLDPSTWPLWLQVLVLGLLLPALLLLLLYASIRGLKRRRRRKRASTGPTASRAAHIWADLVTEARTLGVEVPHAGTSLEQARSLPSDQAPALAARGNAFVFGPGDPAAEAVEEYRVQAEEVRRSMRADASTWQRLRSDIDPRPLFASERIGRRRRPRPTSLPEVAR